MDNPTRGERELLLLKDRKTVWRASLDTLVRIEKAAGCSIFLLLRDPSKITLEISVSVIILGLAHETLDPVDQARIKKAIWDAGLIAVFETVLSLLATAAGGAEEQANPLLPAAGSPG